jgi:hypothetical protein
VSTDEGGVSCPKCRGREQCGSCGRLVNAVSMERLSNGRYEWLRCYDCRDNADKRYRAEEAAEQAWKDTVPESATFAEWMDWLGWKR